MLALTRGDFFWPKLALYVLHYTALLAGLVGMWLYRRRWQIALPLIGLIVYVTLVHLALLRAAALSVPERGFLVGVCRRRTECALSATAFDRVRKSDTEFAQVHS